MRYLKLLTGLAVALSLFGCAEEGILGTGTAATGGTGGTGGTNGITYSGALALKSHFQEKIALVDGSGEEQFRVVGLSVSDTTPPTIIVKGNADTPGAYDDPVAVALFNANVFIYRADSIGQTALNKSLSPDDIAISTDGTKLVHTHDAGKLEIIDPATKTVQQIGSSLTFTTTWPGSQITDDGSLVAFISDADLTGNNPSNRRQIFTLTTDGNDIIKQVTNLTNLANIGASHFALSGDGSIIFFDNGSDLMADGSNADGNDEIFSINTDGSNLKQVTNTTADGTIDEIKSDVNGSTVVFHRYDLNLDPSNALYTVDTGTSTSTFVSNFESTTTGILETWEQFDISSDGSTIFYMTGEKDTSMDHIYSANGDGSNITLLLSNDTNRIKAPHSSADGSSVTFYSKGDFGKTTIEESQYQVYTLTP